MTRSGEPRFFASEAGFRRWLEKHHESESELLVGFWKKGSGKPSIDWPQARDQALCFGWIDGHRKSLGDEAYTIRFTPRRKGSIWSKVNVERYEALKAAGLMTAAGERAYEDNKHKTGVYSTWPRNVSRGRPTVLPDSAPEPFNVRPRLLRTARLRRIRCT